MTTFSNRMEAAKRYALADRTDPWTLARIEAHMRNGICGFTDNGLDAFYSADSYVEERVTVTGTTFPVTVYRNIVRP
jgi:hypothetical protein